MNLKNNRFDYISYVVLVIVSLIFTFPYYNHFGSVPNTPDLPFHLGSRYLAAFEGLKDGQFLPVINPLQNDGTGNGALIFYGPFFAYIFAILYSIFQFIPYGLYFSLVIMMVLEIFLCGLSMYKLIFYFASKNDYQQKQRIAIIGGIFYMTNPWLVHEAYRYGQWGAIESQIFFPLLILGIFQIYNKKQSGILYLSISAAIIICSHTISTWIAILICIIIILFNIKKMKLSIIRDFFISLFLIFGLCAYYLLPFIDSREIGIYNIFPGKNNLQYSGTGSTSIGKTYDYFFAFRYGGSLYAILFIYLVIIIIFFVILIKKKYKIRSKSYITSIIALGLFGLLISTSLLPWSKIPAIFTFTETPARYIILFYLSSSIILGYISNLLIKFFQFSRNTNIIKKVITVGVVSIITVGFMLPYAIFTVQRRDLAYGVAKVSYRDLSNVNLMATTGVDAKFIPKEIQVAHYAYYPDSISGFKKPDLDPKINNYQSQGTHASFEVSNNSDTEWEIQIPYLYYDGYQARDKNGNHLKVSYNDKYFVQVLIPAHFSGEIKTYFGHSVWSLAGQLISFFTLLILIIINIWNRKRRKNEK
jgi:hypothetical protein